MWERAVPFEIGGAKCLAPCPADMLVHVFAHGLRWNGISPLRSVIDAALLLRKHVVDWTHVLNQSARLGLDLTLANALGYLRTAMRAPVPEAVPNSLAKNAVPSIERLLYEAELHRPDEWRLVTALRIHSHIARTQLARSDGILGTWRYFSALRAGRSLGEMAAWARRRLSASKP